MLELFIRSIVHERRQAGEVETKGPHSRGGLAPELPGYVQDQTGRRNCYLLNTYYVPGSGLIPRPEKQAESRRSWCKKGFPDPVATGTEGKECARTCTRWRDASLGGCSVLILASVGKREVYSPERGELSWVSPLCFLCCRQIRCFWSIS